MGTCVVERCGCPVKCRGLCLNCYASAKRLVRLGKVTWAELEKHGLAQPPVYHRRLLEALRLKRAVGRSGGK